MRKIFIAVNVLFCNFLFAREVEIQKTTSIEGKEKRWLIQSSVLDSMADYDPKSNVVPMSIGDIISIAESFLLARSPLATLSVDGFHLMRIPDREYRSKWFYRVQFTVESRGYKSDALSDTSVLILTNGVVVLPIR